MTFDKKWYIQEEIEKLEILALSEFTLDERINYTHRSVELGGNVFHYLAQTKPQLRLFWHNGICHEVEFGVEDLVEPLKAKGHDINKKTNGGMAPLHYFALESNLNVNDLKAFVAGGANINIIDNDGHTPLDLLFQVALEQKSIFSVNLVKEFIELGGVFAKSEPRILDIIYFNPIDGPEVALDLAKILLKKKLYLVNKTYGGKTFLHQFVRQQNYSAVEWLIEFGADVNIADDNGDTPIFMSFCNNIKIAELLISSGANVKVVNNLKQTPLFGDSWSIFSIEFFEKLIEMGLNINHEDIFGHNALLWLLIHGYDIDTDSEIDVINFFIKNGIDINKQENAGNTALLLLSKQNYSNRRSVVKIFIEAGADVNLSNADGKTPLHHYCNVPAIFSILLDAGANIHQVDKLNRTALFYTDKLEIIKIARDCGDFTLVDNEGKTPLHCFYKSKKLSEGFKHSMGLVNVEDIEEIEKKFISYGVVPSLKDNSGNTYLDYKKKYLDEVEKYNKEIKAKMDDVIIPF